ncbi:capsid maturation protease [Mycobacterium phage LilSpotty]|uniref:Capsid maturation protease n=1 Tax=Mycobacterium phage LilSpotty TaxID=2588512 RepID=A0A4Y6ELZ8_9CAUD|nr:capsid maturation protease [Mycobacterium phage LilSpotty]QDF19736.1 capsid maturation protease [Mycobacterium phage LilSpotty]
MALAVSEFQLLLVQLAADLGIRLGRLFTRIDRLDKSEAFAFITDAYPELALPYIASSGELAVQFYNDQPTVSDFVAEPIDLIPDDRLAASGRWALTQNDPVHAITGSAERAVLDQSRDTILENVEAEAGATWARHASANACPFCRMLCTRGAAYLTRGSAGFKSHDNCHCVPAMVRPGDRYEPAPYVQQWEDEYKQARGDADSGDPKAILNAWARNLRK